MRCDLKSVVKKVTFYYNILKEIIMDIKIWVGRRVKELRNKLGISQEELADLVGLDRTYITSVERGRRNISIVNIEKLAKALNVTLSEFFES